MSFFLALNPARSARPHVLTAQVTQYSGGAHSCLEGFRAHAVGRERRRFLGASDGDRCQGRLESRSDGPSLRTTAPGGGCCDGAKRHSSFPLPGQLHPSCQCSSTSTISCDVTHDSPTNAMRTINAGSRPTRWWRSSVPRASERGRSGSAVTGPSPRIPHRAPLARPPTISVMPPSSSTTVPVRSLKAGLRLVDLGPLLRTAEVALDPFACYHGMQSKGVLIHERKYDRRAAESESDPDPLCGRARRSSLVKGM